MSRKSLSRVAAIAALATVGGLVVPLLTASAANAAAPTKVGVVNPAGFAPAGGTATYQVTLDQPAEAAHGVFVAVTAGQDSDPAHPLAGTTCPVAAGVYTCSVTNTHGAGVDQLTFFYAPTGAANFVPADPNTTGTLTIGGAVNAVTITPASAHAAQGVFQEYMVGATDAAGRPVSGTSVNITATQSNAKNNDLRIIPNVTVAPVSIGTDDPSAGPGTRTGSVNTGTDGTPGPVWIASQVVGSVGIVASVGGGSASQAATLTVDAGTVNDITTVTATPPSQTAYTTKQVTVAVVLTNAAGDPIEGVTPLATIAGADAAQPVSATASDASGTSKLTYTALATAGTDTLTVWVNKTTPGHTASKDADEASTTATVTTTVEDLGTVTGTGTTVPNGTLSATVSFAVNLGSDPTKPAAGVGLSFSVPTGYTLSAPTGTTDANGNASVTVTANDAAHATGTHVDVTARVTQDPTKVPGTATVQWQARLASHVVITPFAATGAVGGSTSYSVTTTDQFDAPVTGVSYSWLVTGRNNSTNNTGATGAGSTFSYTDQSLTVLNPGDVGQDQVKVTAKDADGHTLGNDTVQQYWVPGTAKAAQANIDLRPFNGFYASTGTPAAPIFIPTGFTKTSTTGTTTDPATDSSADTVPVEVKLVDANGNPLFGKSVTFTSSGVGGFTDRTGHPLTSPTSTTALVCDRAGSGANGEDANTCRTDGAATVFVRSAQTGTQTITATVDGITDHATVTYSGQYVPVNPERVADTRTGQGSISTASIIGGIGLGGSPAPARLAPNTPYLFSYLSTDMPLDAAAYAFNVTAIDPNGIGNLRVASSLSCGADSLTPTTSLINYQPGKTVANFTVLSSSLVGGGCGGLGLPGMIIYSGHSSASVAIDLVGYYPSHALGGHSDGITPLPDGATRLVDTRTGLGGGAAAPVAAGASRSFQISGQAGIPVGSAAKAVALNVTAVGPKGLGNLRIYPDGSATPTASSINYIKGVDKAAFVIVNLPANGKIDVFSAGSAADVVIDAYEFIPNTATMVTQAPVRILDTRTSSPLEPSVPRNVQVAGQGGVPADAQAVLVSLTSIHTAKSTGVGNLRIFPAGIATPTVSTLNYVSKTADVANFAIVKLGTSGQVTLFSGGSEINAAIDVVGYIPAGG